MNKVDTHDIFTSALEMDVPSQTFYFEAGLCRLCNFITKILNQHRHIFP